MDFSLPDLPFSLPSFPFEFSKMAPAPPPFLPIPRGFIVDQQGIGEWVAYGVQGLELVNLGTVYGEDEQEALSAAEHLGNGKGYSAYKVVEAD